MLSLALLFLKLGTVAFGGPIAHIALMEEELVGRRQWLTRKHFLDLVSITQLIPGPNSTEMAILIGHVLHGWKGMLTAGISFILPAALITVFLTWIYTTYGQLPMMDTTLSGIKAGVLAIILSALIRLSKTAVKSLSLGAISALSLGAALIGISAFHVIVLTGIGGMLLIHCSQMRSKIVCTSLAPIWVYLSNAWPFSGENSELLKLAFFFLKVGSVLFGSGYVLIAYLEDEIVKGYGWLTSQQLLDAVAIGQLTPGPVLTTATCVGYLVSGWTGAIIATISIFLPSFLFVSILNPIVPRMRTNQWTSAFMDSVNAAAVGLMSAVTITLTLTELVTWKVSLITAGIAFLALKWRINGILLIAVSALTGWLLL